MPNSRFALHGTRPSLIHGLCAIFASNSRYMRLFQAPLDTCLDSPVLCQPLSSRCTLHGLCTLERRSSIAIPWPCYRGHLGPEGPNDPCSGQKFSKHEVQDIFGTYRAIPAGPTPLARTLSEHLFPDPLLT